MLALKEMLVFVISLSLGLSSAYGNEAIPITYSGTREHVQFDGKWTFEYEWKESSLNQYSYEDKSLIVLRSAHQGNFVYILLDAVSDESLDLNSDRAIVCFDTKNDKNIIASSDDFCFLSTLGESIGSMYQGDPKSNSENGFTEISRHEEFIGIGGISDENDRYSGIPHATYEFKIPTDVISRNNVYGFYFAVYDHTAKKHYSYPIQASVDNIFSSPSKWGEIYSPDKSLPEFQLPLLVVLPVFALIIILGKTRLFFLPKNNPK